MTVYGVAAHAVELGGIFAIATLGAELCRRRNLNGLAVTFFAMVSALGGGLVRDLLIGAPPVAFHSLGDPAAALAAGLTVVLFGRHLPRVLVPLRVVEAVGLGVLCVHGTAKALAAGQAPVAAAALGVVTVVGGGIVRDSLTGCAPGVFQRGRAARLPLLALIAGTVVVLLRLGRLDHAAVLTIAVGAATMLLMCERGSAAGAPTGAEPVPPPTRRRSPDARLRFPATAGADADDVPDGGGARELGTDAGQCARPALFVGDRGVYQQSRPCALRPGATRRRDDRGESHADATTARIGG